jgi:hypothetical protein
MRDRGGAPVAGAELVLGPYPVQVQLANGELLDGPPPLVLRSGEDGRFAAAGLAPGPLLIHVRARGFAPASTQAQLAAGETGRCEIVLQPGARIAGVVRGAEGEPLAGVAIAGGDEPFRASTRSQADGSFLLAELSSGTVEFRASDAHHGEARTTLLVRSGEETRWDPVLAAGSKVTGTVLDERDRPLEDWQVAAVERHRPGLWLRDDRTDAAGRFELANCPAKPFVLAVRSPAEVFGDPVLLFDDFAPGDEGLLIRVRDADRPSAFLAGRVVAADGAALVQPQVSHQSAAGSFGARYPDEAGRFLIGPLRPGEYALVAEAQGLGDLRAGPFALAPDETREVGTLVLEPPGRIRVRLASPPPPGSGTLTSSLYAGERFADNLAYDGAFGLSGALGRGSYVLRTRAWKWAAPDRTVEVVPGQTTEVELALEPAAYRWLELVLPDGASASAVEVTVRDSAGQVVAESRATELDASQRETLRRGRFRTAAGGLLPGTYSVEARTSTGLAATGAFTVLDLVPVDEPLVLALR